MGECHTFIWRKWLGEYAGVFPTYFHNAFWQLNFLKARKENNFGFLLKGVVQDHKPCVIEFTIIVSDFHVLWAMAVLLLVCGLMVPRRPCPLGSTRALHYPFFPISESPLSAERSVLWFFRTLVAHLFPGLGHPGDRRPILSKASRASRMYVGRFSNTYAFPFCLGGWLAWPKSQLPLLV